MHIRSVIEESGGVRGDAEGKSEGDVSSRRTMQSLQPENQGNARNGGFGRKESEERDERRLIYATIDSLALKGARLPLRLMPIDDVDADSTEIDADTIETTETSGRRAATAINNRKVTPRRPSFKVQRPGLTFTGQWKGRARSRIPQAAGAAIACKGELPEKMRDESGVSWDENQDDNLVESKVRAEPVELQKLSRKSSGRALGGASVREVFRRVSLSGRTRRSKRLSKTGSGRTNSAKKSSRDLRDVSISLPTNFVHVSSATSSELRTNGETTPEAPVYEVLSESSMDEDVGASAYPSRRHLANSSFLWGNGSTGSPARQIDHSSDFDHDTYDDVGLSPCPDFEEGYYDDVGLPNTGRAGASIGTLLENVSLEDDASQIYDDVGPGPVHAKSFSPKPGKVKDLKKRFEAKCETSGNDYSSVDEDEVASETYDSVRGLRQEHVNSIYAGSSSGSRLGSFSNGRDSEWEDLEETAPSHPHNKKNNLLSRIVEPRGSPGKRKIAHGRSRKTGRQISKNSRRTRTSSRSANRTPAKVDNDTASEDSNYETLFSSFPSDEFSSGNSEDEEDEISGENGISGLSKLETRLDPISCQEAPSRPVPPPPRESSLTESLGKRMKILRRTWSITKGSLGRMRRRTSGSNAESDSCSPLEQSANDGRKYFSFKKHFRKNITGLSTFYLDSNDPGNNNECNKEEIYSDSSRESNWYNNSEYWTSRRKDDEEHYSALDEEPLYQFYAAAAARVAFESDSEGYEEVEDPTPLPSTIVLTRPGQRTLWCQTPRVRGSSLLQRLTPDEKKCQEAKFEILTSEASYLNSLRVLVDEFLSNQDLIYDVLTSNERDKLFGGVPSVLNASENFLAELEAVWRQDPMLPGLPEVLQNYAQRSSNVYVSYCSSQVSMDATLKELRSKKGSKFVETVTRIESRPACQSLTLHSFLMLPMQRVTRLPLLADAVLSKLSPDDRDERKLWESALSQLSRVVMECNEGARAAGRLAEMEALERKLEYSPKVPSIVLRDRYLIRRGPVVHILAKSDTDYKLTFGKKYHKASLYLLLLTDYLLITKVKTSGANEETYTVTDSCKRSLVELEKVSEDSPFAGRNAMLLTLLENHSGRQVEYVLTCENSTERERWLDAVSPPKPSLVGESLYETWDCPQVMALYPYAPAQPDELTLQPGDVINVLRKMSDGWYLGEKLLGGEQGWFPGNYAKEVASEHVRARNLRQRHRLFALNTSVLQQRTRHSARIN